MAPGTACLPSLQLLQPTGMGKVFHRHLPWVACPWVHSLYIEETCAGHTQSTKERELRQCGQVGVDDSQGQKPPPDPLVQTFRSPELNSLCAREGWGQQGGPFPAPSARPCTDLPVFLLLSRVGVRSWEAGRTRPCCSTHEARLGCRIRELAQRPPGHAGSAAFPDRLPSQPVRVLPSANWPAPLSLGGAFGTTTLLTHPQPTPVSGTALCSSSTPLS